MTLTTFSCVYLPLQMVNILINEMSFHVCFLTGMFVFLLLNFESSLYALYASQICGLQNIFSHLNTFTFLTIALHFNKIQFVNFSFYVLHFDVKCP